MLCIKKTDDFSFGKKAPTRVFFPFFSLILLAFANICMHFMNFHKRKRPFARTATDVRAHDGAVVFSVCRARV